MCRNIKTLHNFEPPATPDEVRASALQFVRKLSGFTRPSKANEAAFNRAVDQVTEAAQDLLAKLPDNADPDADFDREYRQRLFAAASSKVQAEVDALHWRIFWLFAVEGQSGAVVAATCQVKLDQVYVIRQRIQKKLTEAIAELEE